MKEPTLKLQLLPAADTSPSLKSYIGGKPYMEKSEVYPTCKTCQKSLQFIFQLYIPKNEDYFLYSFYFCQHCDPMLVQQNYEMVIHQNPTLEQMKRRLKSSPQLDYVEFDFHPTWSLPEWDVLQTIHPKIAQDIAQQFEEDAWVIYENIKDSMVGIIFMEPFSFFGGYPQFLSEPRFPICKHCKKPMKLWMQLDSFEDFGLTWAESMGCLYIFQCEEHNDTFHASVQ